MVSLHVEDTTHVDQAQRPSTGPALHRRDGALLPASDSIAADKERLQTAITSLIRRELAIKEDRHVLITDTGRAAIGVGQPDADTEGDVGKGLASPPTSEDPARPASKIETVLTLLRREQGSTLVELVRATGWLPHTTRAALTGLRKKGHAIGRRKRDKVSCYRIGSAA